MGGFEPEQVSAPSPMLHLKRIGLRTYGEHVAFLSADCRAYTPESFVTINKIEIVAANGRKIIASVNIVENGDLLDPFSVGLSTAAFDILGLAEGDPVTIQLARPPHSFEFVRSKIRGENLNTFQISAIINDIVARRYTKTEIAAFLVASAALLTPEEVLCLTRAMANAGSHIDWREADTPRPAIMDKHCAGGIPGNRTSMIVVPIVAACGVRIPKTSSRAITSPAGTADTMEVLANVDVSLKTMKDIVNTHFGCLVWGGHVNLSPADDILISVERPLGIDTPEQMVASILSKKMAAGSTHILIDIPVGPTAKVRSESEAAHLSALFREVGQALGLKVDIVVTDGTQPVGNGVGPVLEARDVMAVLRNDRTAPDDLRQRALMLAGSILEFDERYKGRGTKVARRALEDGSALAAMERIIAAQGPAPVKVELGHMVHEVTTLAAGVVVAIDCARIARIARLAGAPVSKGAGIDLLKKVGDAVSAGEPLYRIHAAVETDFVFATEIADEAHGYTIA